MAYGIKKITGWACHGPGMMRLKIHLAGQPSSIAWFHVFFLQDGVEKQKTKVIS